jgi:putative peptidoglycan binding protein
MTLSVPASVSRLPARALLLLPAVPVYAVAAGVAVLLAIVFGARAAAGEELEEGSGAQPSGEPPILKSGSSGPWVSFLQFKLAIGTSGIFDAATGAAVRAFQSANGLTPDEVVGPKTWGALGVEVAAAPPPSSPSGPGPSAPPPTPPGPAPAPTTGNPFGLAETIDEREGQILDWISQDAVDHQWWPLTYQTKDGHTVKIDVSRRALALSNGPNTRLIVNGSMRSAQKAADMLGGSIPTTRILDEIAKQATTIPMPAGAPPSRKWQGTGGDDTGSKTFRMYDQSNYLEKYVKGAEGLVDGEGKDWVQTRRYWAVPVGTNTGDKPTKNHANFGWHYGPAASKSPGGMPVIQSIGMVHGPGFTDYSQLWRFVRNGSLTIDGQPWDWAAALADPTVSQYIQDEGGTMPAARHPDL